MAQDSCVVNNVILVEPTTEYRECSASGLTPAQRTAAIAAAKRQIAEGERLLAQLQLDGEQS